VYIKNSFTTSFKQLLGLQQVTNCITKEKQK